MTENRYLRFEDAPQDPARKTKTVWVIATRSNSTLGRIEWFGRWRQYAFHPDAHTVFNVECMEAIGDKIRELMAQRRRANRLERAAR